MKNKQKMIEFKQRTLFIQNMNFSTEKTVEKKGRFSSIHYTST